VDIAEIRIRSLQTARNFAELGACNRTIAWVTGLSFAYIRQTLHDVNHPAPNGRPPYQRDFYFRRSHRIQAEVSSFAVRYRSLIAQGFLPPESLLTAYRHYLSFSQFPSFNLDEAFNLVSQLDGRWLTNVPTLQLLDCLRCQVTHLAEIGSQRPRSCPYCTNWLTGNKAVAVPDTRLARPRLHVQSDTTVLSEAFTSQIGSIAFKRQLQTLAADPRVIAALLSSFASARAASAPPLLPSVYLARGAPSSLRHWIQTLSTGALAIYSLLADHFSRLVLGGFSAERSLVSAYRHVRSLTAHVDVSFDRSFQVVGCLQGLWGIPQSHVDLVTCEDCGAAHLVQRLRTTPAHCPFCSLVQSSQVFESIKPDRPYDQITA
jgi:flagellar transcriptional activator FlhC